MPTHDDDAARTDPAAAGEAVARDVLSAPDGPDARRDRREHGGLPPRPDDDGLAERTAQERVDAGLADYDPATVPPATDAEPRPVNVTDTAEYREERREIERQIEAGELVTGTEQDFPPSSYPNR